MLFGNTWWHWLVWAGIGVLLYLLVTGQTTAAG